MEFEVKHDLSRVVNILGNLEDSTGLARSHLKNESDDDSGWDTDLECEGLFFSFRQISSI